jgi:mono/diheme cytochrome c family protein
MNKPMRVLGTLGMLAMVVVGGACKDPGARGGGGAGVDPKAEIERGRYLVSTSGCHDCHTPWAMGPNGAAPDMTRALSGHPRSLEMPPAPAPTGPWVGATSATNTAWSGPWGTSFTANLTPDKETGLGAWTRQNFIDTIRNARHMGAGRPLLPPMPAPVYAQMTDADLGAVFAYLQTIPAISNRVPAPRPPATAVLGAAGTNPG